MVLLSALLKRNDVGSWPFIIWISVILVIFIFSYLYGIKRKNDLTAAASTIGFFPADDVPISCGMPVFNRKTQSSNIFTGTSQGYEATFFDLRVGQGKGSYTQTVVGFRRTGLVMPPFQVHPTDFADRISKMFSSEIVKIDTDPNFPSRYTLRSPSPELCRNFFTPELMSYFVQLPPHKWTIEGSDDSLIVYQRGKTIAASKIAEYLNETGNVAAGLLGQLRPTSVL